MICDATLTSVGLLALVGAALAALTDAAATCQVTKTKPTFDLSQLKAINSNNGMLLAKMGAYLEFNDNLTFIEDGKKYLELELEKVDFRNSAPGTGGTFYIFKTDCASIIMLMEPRQFASMFVTVDLSLNPNNITWNADSYNLRIGHNKCRPRAFTCSRSDALPSQVATINFVDFEYEVSEDLESHRNKKFALPLTEYC